MELAIFFPGQGSHYIGMGRELYDKRESVRRIYAQASDILEMDMPALCFRSSFSILNAPENMFPAIVTLGIAMHEVFLEESGHRYTCIYAGHSLGEYSALIAAGGLSLADGLKLVRYRGQLTNSVFKNLPVKMYVIDGITLEILNDITHEIEAGEASFFIACYNAMDQFVVAASDGIFLPLQKAIHTKKGMLTPLPNGIPFHTPFMESCRMLFKSELDKYTVSCPTHTVLANVTARPYRNDREIAQNLQDQLVQPVRWNSIMQWLTKRNVTGCLEMSAKGILCGLLSRSHINLPAFIYGQEESHRLWTERFACVTE